MTFNLRSAAFTAVALLSLSTTSAYAATVVLTFDGFACRTPNGFGATNATCTFSGQSIGSDYGTTTGLNVLYGGPLLVGNPNGQLTAGIVGDFGVGQGGNVSFVAGVLPATPSEIFFTPTAGYEVSMVSFARSRAGATFNPAFFQLFDQAGAEIYRLDATGGIAKVFETVNSAYSTGPLTFKYGAFESGFTVVDDITLEVRQINTAQVPEPSTWSMLAITGLGGLLVARKRNQKKQD